ncbi:MAG: hypothetical protein ACK5JU_00820 [Bacteroidales bacterium]
MKQITLKPLALWFVLLLSTHLFPANSVSAKGASVPEDSTRTSTSMHNPFIAAEGTMITDPKEWNKQREYLQSLLTIYIYGQTPALPKKEEIVVEEERITPVYDGKGIMETKRLRWDNDLCMNIRIVYPKKPGRYPVIMKLDYLCDFQYRNEIEETLIKEERYAVVTISRKELAPDIPDNGLYPLNKYPTLKTGAIAMWGYGAMVCMTYIENKTYVDAEKVVLTGHSRDGKAVLYACAMDERFAIAAPNGSGCGGAAPLVCADAPGEKLSHLQKAFPHWFTEKLTTLKSPDLLSVDTHITRALIAPRAVINTEALNDRWANLRQAYYNVAAAEEVYRFLGVKERNGSHYRPGEHNFTTTDMRAIIAFSDFVFYGKTPDHEYSFFDHFYPIPDWVFRWKNPLSTNQ